ncbi:hypothetical protein ACS0TY_032108 [Phlomoides rotata]
MEVETAECVGALRGVQLAKELNIRKLHLETDSKILFQALRSPKPDLSLFGSFAKEILDLQRWFDDLKFS